MATDRISSSAEAARRAAEEAARRAREEAARLAAEAKAREAAAKAAAEQAAAAKKAKLAGLTDEQSTGAGKALRDRALTVTGAQGAASSLETEVRNDGVANCLEKAADLAKPGDNVVLLDDARDPVGHAVVQRADGSVTDPNAPEKNYESLEQYQTQNPHYSNPAVVADEDVEKILSTPPGAKRHQLIEELHLAPIANRAVADSEVRPEVKASVDSVIGPTATPEQRQAAYAQVQAYVDEVGGVGDAGITQEALYQRSAELLAEKGIPTAARPEVIAQVETVLGDKVTPAQRQQAYAETQQRVTFDQTTGKPSDPSSIPALAAQVAKDAGIPAVDPRVVNIVNTQLGPGASQYQRADAYQNAQAYIDEVGGIGDAGITEAALPGKIHELITGEPWDAKAVAAKSAAAVTQLAEDGKSQDEVTAALQAELAKYPGDTAYQQALGAELAKRMNPRDPVNQGADDLQKRSEVLATAVVAATEKSGQAVATEVARGFASVVNDKEQYFAGSVLGDNFAAAFERPIRDQGALAFSIALADELQKAGNGQSAGRVDRINEWAMVAVQKSFQDQNGKIEELHEELAQILGPVGGALTDEQRKKAVEEFQARHKDEFDQWEAAGAKYAQMMRDVGAADKSQWSPEMKLRAEGFVKDLPTLARTQAGTEFLAEELEKQGANQPGFMDVVAQMGEQGKLEKEMLEALSVCITRSVGMRAMAYAQAGNAAAATDLLEGLRRNANVFGVTGRTMDDLVDTLGTLRPGMSQADLATFAARYNTNLDSVLATGINPKGGAVQSLRALGVVVGAAYTLDGFANEKDLALKTQFLSDALGMGADAGMTVVEALNASGRFAAGTRGAGFVSAAGKVFHIGAAVTGGVSAIVDGITAAKAFSEGKVLDGAASAQMAVGGILMSAAALQVIPGWGQLAGAALLFGGLATSIVAGKVEEGNIRDERKELLIAAGVPENVAQALRDANTDRMGELINEMHLSPEQIQELATKWPYLLTQGEGNGVSLDGVRQLQQASGMSNDQLMELFRKVGTGEEADRAMAMLLGNTGANFAMGDRETKAGWLEIANNNLKNASGDEEYERVWTIIRDSLQ